MRTLILIQLFVFSILCFSFKQGVKTNAWEIASKAEVLIASEKSSDWFSKNKNYKVDITYSSFTDHSSTSAHDTYNGFYKKDNSNFHSSAMGVNTIQNEKMKLTIDTVNHMIILNNKTEMNQAPADSKKFSELLDKVKSITKQKGDNEEITYRLEFKPNALYHSYEFKVNGKGLLVFMKYYFSKELKEEDNAMKGKPRLEVSFSNYQTNVGFNYEKEFSEKLYLKEERKKIVLNDKYQKFEFKDYRFTEKK